MSAQHEARILIVDDQRAQTRVLRTSLELLNHGYLITDVPSGEEAILELTRFNFDLLISDYRLPGMSGAELVKRATRMNPGIKAIMMKGTNVVHNIQREIDGLPVLSIFDKPLDVEAFTDKVDEILIGKQDEETGEVVMVKIEPLPTADFDHKAADREVATLLEFLGCEAVALVTRTGRIETKGGTFSEAMCFPELAVLLASNFTTTFEISTYIGEQPPSGVHYYSNNWHDIFALTVSTDFFLVMVFPGGSQKQMPMVLNYGKKTAERIGKVIYGEMASEVVQAVPVPEPAPVAPALPVSVAQEAPRISLAEEIRQQRRAEELARREAELIEEPPPPVFAELLEESSGETLDLNFDDLDADLADLDADSLWDDDAMAAQAEGTDAMSMEEAMELGFLPDEMEE